MEDKLAILENAVAGLAATSAIRHNEVTTQLNNLMQHLLGLQTIIKQQNVLETKLDRILNKKDPVGDKNKLSSVIKGNVEYQTAIVDRRDEELMWPRIRQEYKSNVEQTVKEATVQPQISSVSKPSTSATEQWHGYINWEQTHDSLLKHSYVPLKKFHDSISMYLDYKDTCLKQFLDIIKSPHKIDKTTRFPSDGIPYLNINLPVIQFHMHTALSYVCDDRLLDELEFCDALSKLWPVINNIILNELDGIHNEMSFEEKYKLIWVDEIKQTEDKIDNKLEQLLDMQREQLNCALSLNVQFELLNCTLTRFETHVEKKMISGQVELCKVGYVNWADCHEPLKLHLYIPIDSFYKTIDTLKYLYNLPIEKQDMLASKTIPWGTVFQVTEKDRFPSEGVYINVNLPIIKYQTDNLCNAVLTIRVAKQSDLGQLNVIATNLLRNVMNAWNDLTQNITTFEDKYKLKWVEKT